MNTTTRIAITGALGAVAVAAAIPALTGAQTTGGRDVTVRENVRAAATRTQTLRLFDKPTSMKLTHANGTVAANPQSVQPRPGDTLDVDSLDYRGDHSHHAKRFSASTHLRCTFGAGPPTCESHVAIGNSMLIFTGDPGIVSNGTGIYQGATGRVLSSKEVSGGSDVVARVKRR
jgi:hypothetical protein